MESTKITESPINNKSFPQGSVISSRLPSHAVGNLLEVHEFICGFQNVLGLNEPISFEELEKELLGVGKSSILKKVEKFIHSVLLPDLVNKLLEKTAAAIGIKLELLDLLPVNQLTWQEVVRRYIKAHLLLNGRTVSENDIGIELFQCLQGDGGICCKSQASVAGLDLDAKLLGSAMENVFGQNGVCTDDVLPEWVKVLEPVKKLPTNNGSRIRKCVYEALNKNPPEWAKHMLEASIEKGVYKGNASGPTKNAVKAVIERATNTIASDVPQRPLPLDTDIRRSEEIFKAVMTKFESILRHVASNITDRDFSEFLGRSLNCDNSDVQNVLKYASTRPLDLHTIRLRLLHGTYGASYEALQEDVRELGSSLKMWIKLMKTPVNKPSLSYLAECMSKDLELRLENEVEKEPQEILASIEISETPWEMIICKECGSGEDEENMLRCDSEGCDAAYHTYCLNLPFSEIPEGKWHCPPCKQPVDKEPNGVRQILQDVDRWEEANLLLEKVTALEGRDYWELEADELSVCEANLLEEIIKALEGRDYWKLEADKKIFILKFLFDKALSTERFRQTLHKSGTKLAKRFLGNDSLGRFYWGFPSSSPNCGIMIYENLSHCNSKWYLLRSEEEMSSLVEYLYTTDPQVVHLRDSISHWHSSILHEDQQITHNSVERHMVSSTNLNKSAKKSGGDGSCPILGQLKIKLLEIEGALTDEARRPSRASPEWRSAWRAFVKSANTIKEMVEAILVLETMIKTNHINNRWWWYWSSASVAANTSTLSALALRIYTLDASINHSNKPPDPANGKKVAKKAQKEKKQRK